MNFNSLFYWVHTGSLFQSAIRLHCPRALFKGQILWSIQFDLTQRTINLCITVKLATLYFQLLTYLYT